VEKPTRSLTGPHRRAISIIAVGFAVFQIWYNSFGVMPGIIMNCYHLGFLLVLCFLLYPPTKRSSKERIHPFDYVLALGGVAVGVYLPLAYNDLHLVRGSVANTRDYAFAILALLLVLEAARRTTGPIIPTLSVLFLLYTRFGRYFPGILAHGGLSWTRILYRMYLTYEGLFGITLSVSATFIFLFILFGAFLQRSGASGLFNDLALALAGARRGGPAQVAVISSAMMGTLSGSAVANVATTGSFTIPLMKSIGYTPAFAGAVEAAASTGGMIMPPIMGAAAFIMASFLELPYARIMLAAVIPALLYYAAIMLTVDIEARKLGLVGLPRESIPRVREVLGRKGLLLLPIVVVIYTLLIGKTPLYAGFAGIIATVAAAAVRKETRMGPRDILAAMETGALGAVQVGIACGACGIMVGVAAMTGIGSVLAHNILRLSGGVPILTLLLVMIISIILSLGLPSTALYIIVAVVAAPALVRAGLLPLAAHMFVFWFGAMSNVTPPVALASYTAAGLAGSDPTRTGFTGLKLTLAGFLIPFMFAFDPVLLLEARGALDVLLAVGSGLVGVYALAAALENFYVRRLSPLERVLFFSAAVMLIKPGLATDLGGLGLVALALASHLTRHRARPETAGVGR
jgi:TRAP transporter 4TM/12TM fusion protein